MDGVTVSPGGSLIYQCLLHSYIINRNFSEHMKIIRESIMEIKNFGGFVNLNVLKKQKYLFLKASTTLPRIMRSSTLPGVMVCIIWLDGLQDFVSPMILLNSLRVVSQMDYFSCWDINILSRNMLMTPNTSQEILLTFCTALIYTCMKK